MSLAFQSEQVAIWSEWAIGVWKGGVDEVLVDERMEDQ